MSVPFDQQVSVYTFCHDPQWLQGNANQPDLLLIFGVSMDQARSLVHQLRWVNVDAVYEIRDVHNKTVARFETRPPLKSSAPTRRALGPGRRETKRA